MAIDLLAVSSHGCFQTGGGSCDYPSEDDVRDGTDYAFGAMTGNLVLPAEDDMLEGTGYGSNGTEFTGTLVPCPTPPTPVPPTPGAYPFAAITWVVKQRLALLLGISTDWVMAVANDKYKVTIDEPMFCYLQFFGVSQPRDPALEFTNSGAGRLSIPVARRMRVYLYTRTGEDIYGSDDIALFGQNPSQTVDTPPTLPGHFVAEEMVFNSLLNFIPLSGDATPEPLTLTPLHPLDASEEPQRPPEDEQGLLRSCLDFEICYLLAIDPTDPAAT